MTMPNFTDWRLSLDSPTLRLLTIRNDGSIAECIELDIAELPDHPELLARLGPKARARLLAEAARTTA